MGALTTVLTLALGTVAGADHFDDHTGVVIAEGAKSPAVKKVDALTLDQLKGLPHPIEGNTASGMLIVRTDDGNWAKLLVRPARRKLKGKEETVEIALIERWVTYRANTRSGVFSDGRNAFLFAGFAIDLDMGAVVPHGQGEDLRFERVDGNEALKPAKNATLYLVAAPLTAPAEKDKPRRFSQGAVTAKDFEGTYRLQADGRWSGKLQLQVADDGAATGEYVSEKTGQTYSVEGKVGGPAHHIVFKIAFPMTEQRFEGYLWTHNRGKITGVTHMLDRPFGFLAERTD
jgi:hypothetical protein